MKFTVFSSGSSGNSSLLSINGINILIDAGITKKQIGENLEKSGLDFQDIKYLFYTHEHVDHVRAFPQMLKVPGIIIYISEGTLDSVYESLFKQKKTKECDLINLKIKNNEIRIFKKCLNSILYEPFIIDDIKVDIIPLFHDAKEPTGFVFTYENERICYITDTGYVHSDTYKLISNCDIYMFESNHDPEVLMASDRPYFTKLRIAGDHGHLSNEDSMYVLTRVIGEKTTTILHAHVSQECNLTEIINLTRKRVFDSYDIDESKYKCVVLGPYRSEEFVL